MIKLKTDDNLIRLILIIFFFFILYNFILQPLGFLLPVKLNTNDNILNVLKTAKHQPDSIDNIVVISIDDEVLSEIGKKWPWDRIFTAEVIEKIAGYKPKIIGIDLTLFGKSINPEEDEKLIDAMRKAGNVVLPSKITEKEGYALPYTPFVNAAYGVGFTNKMVDPDFKIRMARLVYQNPSNLKACFSFEIIIAAAYLGIPPDKINYANNKIAIGKELVVPLEKNNSIYINYLPVKNIPVVLTTDLLQDKPGLKETIEDKIVFFGTTSKIGHDVMQTPYGLMPGVFTNVFTLNTILKQAFIKNIPDSLYLPIILTLILLFAVFTYNLSIPRGVLFFGIGLFLMFLGFYITLLYDFKLDYFSFIFLAALSYFTANIYKYGYLLYFSNKLKRMVITDNVTGLATARYFQFKLQLDISKTSEAKSGISIVIFAIPQLSELFKQHKHEQSEPILSQLSIILKQNSRKKADLLAKWKEDKFAAILLKTNIDEASIYVQKIISKIEENEFLTTEAAVRLNVHAGISNYPAVKTESAAGLISCAEAASNRAKLTQQKICAFNPQHDKVHVDILKRKSSESEEDYLTMDIAEREKELLETLNELKNSQQEIQRAHFETILSLVKALEEKDQYTAGHSERVANYAVGIAKQLGIEDPELTLIRQSALLHDMGKFGLPDSILHKKEALTQDEIGEIKKHPVLGKRILEKSKFFENHIPLIVHHHEKYDGTGYPHGLSGKFIPRGAQIIAIADAIDAMTSGRGYNHVLNIQEVIEELKKSEGRHFDPDYTKPAIDYLLGASKR